jgi:uroporphyrin-III C-methyltransferase
MSERHFAALDALEFPSFNPGSVWLAGAGPGAAGLISLLGYHALGQADVIVYDALVGEGLLALAPPATERLYAGKRGGKPSPRQASITETLIARARAGQRVLRLKGGDPMMFGRGAEEALALAAAGIPFRIVPGISAGLGGLAYAGLPVTYRDANHVVIFLTGHDETGSVPAAIDWEAVARAAPVLVMFMAVKHLPAIAARLLAAGRASTDRLAVVAKATLQTQSVTEVALGEVEHHLGELPTPAIVVVGPVTALRPTLDWYTGALRENPLG